MLPKSNHTIVLKPSKNMRHVHVVFALVLTYFLLVAIYPIYVKIILILVLLVILSKNNHITRIDDFPNDITVQMSCGKIYKYENFEVLFDLGFMLFVKFIKHDKEVNRVVFCDQLSQIDRQYLHTRSYFQ